MTFVKLTETRVVEVGQPTDPTLGSWSAVDVAAAAALSDAQSSQWEDLGDDESALSSADAYSLRVWREYRDGKKTRTDRG